MRQIKNFTTKDWWIMMGCMFCFCFLMTWAYRAFLLEDEYVRGILHMLGAAGWAVIYCKYMKKVEKKNE